MSQRDERVDLPDVYPLERGRPEVIVTPATIREGYQDTASAIGIPEAQESVLTLGGNESFWERWDAEQHRKAVLRTLKHAQEKRDRKRKAGCQYDVPLGGIHVDHKQHIPKIRVTGMDEHNRWLQRLMDRMHMWSPNEASYIPLPDSKCSSLLSSLAQNRVPLLQAIWIIQVCYLNKYKTPSAPDYQQCIEALTTDLTNLLDSLLAELNPSQPPSPGLNLTPSFNGSPIPPEQIMAISGLHNQAAASLNSTGMGSVPSTGNDTEGGGTGGVLDYVIRLVGWALREGLLDLGGLLDWLLERLGRARMQSEEGTVLMPLLGACVQDAVVSPEFARRILLVALSWHKRLRSESGEEVSNNINVPITPNDSLHKEVIRIIRFIMRSNHLALVGLNLLDDLEDLESLVDVKHNLKKLRARQQKLANAVNPSVLSVNEPELMGQIEKALQDGNAAEPVKILSNIPNAPARAIRILCDWCVSDPCHTTPPTPNTAITNFEATLHTKSLQSVRRLFTVNALHLFSKNQEKQELQKRPVLHDCLVEWLKYRAGHGGGSDYSSQCETMCSREVKGVLALLLSISESGIVSAGEFVRQLIGDGSLDEGQEHTRQGSFYTQCVCTLLPQLKKLGCPVPPHILQSNIAQISTTSSTSSDTSQSTMSTCSSQNPPHNSQELPQEHQETDEAMQDMHQHDQEENDALFELVDQILVQVVEPDVQSHYPTQGIDFIKRINELDAAELGEISEKLNGHLKSIGFENGLKLGRVVLDRDVGQLCKLLESVGGELVKSSLGLSRDPVVLQRLCSLMDLCGKEGATVILLLSLVSGWVKIELGNGTKGSLREERNAFLYLNVLLAGIGIRINRIAAMGLACTAIEVTSLLAFKIEDPVSSTPIFHPLIKCAVRLFLDLSHIPAVSAWFRTLSQKSDIEDDSHEGNIRRIFQEEINKHKSEKNFVGRTRELFKVLSNASGIDENAIIELPDDINSAIGGLFSVDCVDLGNFKVSETMERLAEWCLTEGHAEKRIGVALKAILNGRKAAKGELGVLHVVEALLCLEAGLLDRSKMFQQGAKYGAYVLAVCVDAISKLNSDSIDMEWWVGLLKGCIAYRIVSVHDALLLVMEKCDTAVIRTLLGQGSVEMCKGGVFVLDIGEVCSFVDLCCGIDAQLGNRLLFNCLEIDEEAARKLPVHGMSASFRWWMLYRIAPAFRRWMLDHLKWKESETVIQNKKLPARVIMDCLAAGSWQVSSLTDGCDYRQYLMHFLGLVSPASFQLHLMQIRLVLQEQVFSPRHGELTLNTVEDWCKSLQTSSKVGSSARDVRDAEKAFVTLLLSFLPICPKSAPLFSEMCWQLGTGVGEYLLMRIDWILQDRGRSSLLGRSPLIHVLPKRDGDRSLDASVEPFSVEQGLIDMALIGLAKGTPNRRRDFAHEIVQQLQALSSVIRSSNTVHANDAMSRKQGRMENVTSPGGVEVMASPNRDRKSNRGFGSSRSTMTQERGEGKGEVLGPINAVKVSLWLRFGVLLPLLPIVYADKHPETNSNLRHLLAVTLIQLLTCPVLWDASSHARNALNSLNRAEQFYSMPLFDVLLHTLVAILSSTWVNWLKGKQTQRLREVGAYEGVKRLEEEIEVSKLPVNLLLRVKGAMPVLPGIVLNNSGDRSGRKGVSPWSVLSAVRKGGCVGNKGGGIKAPNWLEGAIRRPRRS